MLRRVIGTSIVFVLLCLAIWLLFAIEIPIGASEKVPLMLILLTCIGGILFALLVPIIFWLIASEIYTALCGKANKNNEETS